MFVCKTVWDKLRLATKTFRETEKKIFTRTSQWRRTEEKRIVTLEDNMKISKLRRIWIFSLQLRKAVSNEISSERQFEFFLPLNYRPNTVEQPLFVGSWIFRSVFLGFSDSLIHFTRIDNMPQASLPLSWMTSRLNLNWFETRQVWRCLLAVRQWADLNLLSIDGFGSFCSWKASSNLDTW